MLGRSTLERDFEVQTVGGVIRAADLPYNDRPFCLGDLFTLYKFKPYGFRTMPIYEYRCQQCGHQLATLQKLADAPLTDCPACQASALRKLLSTPGLRFKSGAGCEAGMGVGTRNYLNSCDSGRGCQGCPASK